MEIKAAAFKHEGKIPMKFTCDAENVNPALIFQNVPTSARSLALIMDDPDIPDFVKEKFKIEVFDHWVLFNIHPETKGIEEGAPAPGVEGSNSSNRMGYTGPCPPDREHRYFFKLYALDTNLKLKQGVSKAEVEKAMKGHIIATAELIGKYERVKK